MGDIWVWCGDCRESACEEIRALLAKAQQLSGEKQQVCAVVASKDEPRDKACLGSANRILWLPTDGSCVYLGNILAVLAKERQPEVILLRANVTDSHIASRAAVKLETGLCADCTDLRMENGNLVMHRPAFGGGVEADIVCENARPQMATVRSGVFARVQGKVFNPILEILEIPTVPEDTMTLLDAVSAVQTADLTQAEIVVAGGLGVGSRENFEILERLAEKLGGCVGASRAAVDAGFAPWSVQVGQTGVSVHPKIYFAFGIHGSVQHIMGMHNSDLIVAVNTDPKAPIFQYADIGIVDDWKTVAEQILQAL